MCRLQTNQLHINRSTYKPTPCSRSKNLVKVGDPCIKENVSLRSLSLLQSMQSYNWQLINRCWFDWTTASLPVNDLISTKPAHWMQSILSRGVKLHCLTHAQYCTIVLFSRWCIMHTRCITCTSVRDLSWLFRPLESAPYKCSNLLTYFQHCRPWLNWRYTYTSLAWPTYKLTSTLLLSKFC